MLPIPLSSVYVRIVVPVRLTTTRTTGRGAPLEVKSPSDGAVTLTPGPSERSGMRRLRGQAGTAMQGHREIYRRRIGSNHHVCDGEPLPYGLDGGELVMMGKTVANG